MTQEQLAAETGIAKRSIIIYESGQRPPKMEKIYEAFAEFFSVPIVFLKVEREDDFDKCAEYAYGTSGKKQAEDLANKIAGLFAGGKVSVEDADKVMRALNGVRYKGREVRCNDADEGAPRSNASLKKKEYGRKKTDGRRNAGGRKDNGGAKGKDDWRALMKGGDVDFKDEEPDFSEEGWARRYPKKK